MSSTITLEDGMQSGHILPHQCILTEVPKDKLVSVPRGTTGFNENQEFRLEAGTQQLWRLENEIRLWSDPTNNRPKLLGEPTKELLTLHGQEGFRQGLDAMNDLIGELYAMPGIFEKALAYSPLAKDHFFFSYDTLKKTLEEVTRQLLPDDRQLKNYWVASRCANFSSSVYADFGVFCVNGGNMSGRWLYSSDCFTYTSERAVRPIVTPKFTLLLETEGCDGSPEKPWRCVSK